VIEWGNRAVHRSCIVLVAAAAFAAPAARAAIIAAVNEPVPNGTSCPTQTDIALIDPATGTRTALPPGVNTSANELHPSIAPDGRRMAFETYDPTAGTVRIRVVDLTTGDQADLFNAFETAGIQPTTPTITPDGSSVITGVPLVPTSSGKFAAAWEVTSLANFPGGPFPHTQRAANATFTAAGQTLDPYVRGDGDLVSDVLGQSTSDLLLSFPGGLSSVATNDSSNGHPALSDPTSNVVVFQQMGSSTTFPPQYTDLVFRPASGFPSAASTELPALVSSAGGDELQPAFTPDGRYLGFIRNAHSGDHHDRLFVFDTQTQTMLDNSGIDLGYFSFSCDRSRFPFNFTVQGGISLRETFTLTFSSLNFSTGLFTFQVQSSTGIGILVQRIVGHHRLLGRLVPTLKSVGRVPFGRFKHGKHHVHWNLRVNGHRLRPGTYLVTPRLLTRKGVVDELGKPRILHVH
jgi:dipeptidyl aminopeptidase/acylaminoacyl peptidase